MISVRALAHLPHPHFPTGGVRRIAGHTVALTKSAPSRASGSIGVSATGVGQRRGFSADRSADILGRLRNSFDCKVVDEANINQLYRELLKAQDGQCDEKFNLIPQVDLINGQKVYLGSRPQQKFWRHYRDDTGKHTIEFSTMTKLSSLSATQSTLDRPSAPGVVFLGEQSLHAQNFQIELKKDDQGSFRVTKFSGFESCKLFDRDGKDLLPAPSLRDRFVQWIRRDGRA